jgi:putative SOS response-associated peptidase YedK
VCNHFANIPGAQQYLQTWREYVGWADNRPLPPELQSIPSDVWPKGQALIARNGDEGAICDTMQWGVPLKLAGKRPGTTITKRVTNVRNLDSPFWRSMLNQPEQRCLVPFTAFAEPKPNSGRDEIWFKVKEQHVSAFAGIWRPSEEGNVFAILTCEPNPLVAKWHPKAMPVILHPEDYQRWLDGEPADKMAQPFPSQMMAIVERTPNPQLSAI